MTYWESRITTSFTASTGIVTFDVEAFAPEDAEKLAALFALSFCKELVNDLSIRARRDALAYAEEEVERAEARLKDALDAVEDIPRNGEIHRPVGDARAQTELISTLDKQLVNVKARIAALRPSCRSDAPSLRNLMRQDEALAAADFVRALRRGCDPNGKPGRLTVSSPPSRASRLSAISPSRPMPPPSHRLRRRGWKRAASSVISPSIRHLRVRNIPSIRTA